jgi:MFS family permease
MKLDLTCVNEHVITLIGGFYFFGFGMSCIVVPRAADIVGRKYPFIISMMF